ncbi:hypothetical protein LCGC14_2196510 [marine sediment metagenome]|uniref:Uncharacterized protein n=1 Tax=marine sediment metagenome TaxID=412755 RepID=A0A0F9E564_9ZZZZ
MNKLTKKELSLLLYFESRAVDHRGLIDTRHLNKEDFKIAEKMKESGLIDMKRWTQRDIIGQVEALTYRVWLFDEAWTLAHEERRERAARMAKKLDD